MHGITQNTTTQSKPGIDAPNHQHTTSRCPTSKVWILRNETSSSENHHGNQSTLRGNRNSNVKLRCAMHHAVANVEHRNANICCEMRRAGLWLQKLSSQHATIGKTMCKHFANFNVKPRDIGHAYVERQGLNVKTHQASMAWSCHHRTSKAHASCE